MESLQSILLDRQDRCTFIEYSPTLLPPEFGYRYAYCQSLSSPSSPQGFCALHHRIVHAQGCPLDTPLDRGLILLKVGINLSQRFDIRAPSDWLILFHLGSGDELGPKWHGYHYEFLYTHSILLPPEVEHPWANTHFVTLRMRAWQLGTSGFLETTWEPGDDERGKHALKGIEEVTSKNWGDLRRFLDLLRVADRTGPREESREEARQRLCTAIKQLADEDLKVSRTALSGVTFLSTAGVDKLRQRAEWTHKDLERIWSSYRSSRLRQ